MSGYATGGYRNQGGFQQGGGSQGGGQYHKEPPIDQPMRYEFKGNPMLAIPFGRDRQPFKFGLSKARAIVENIDDIIAFVKDNESTN